MNTKEIMQLAVTLGFVAGLCGVALAAVYSVTQPRIEYLKDEALKASLREVVPAASEFIEKNASTGESYFVGVSHGRHVGYAFTVYSEGYSSTIEILVGVDLEGTVTGVKVLYQLETPGLGARIEEVRVGERRPWFTRQFAGKRGKDLNLMKSGGGIDAITGATISSAAVSDGVREGVEDMMEVIKTDE